jgi:hypothetical protein
MPDGFPRREESAIIQWVIKLCQNFKSIYL